MKTTLISTRVLVWPSTSAQGCVQWQKAHAVVRCYGLELVVDG